MSSLADQYRRWFAYEQDAHAKTLRSLESAPESARSTADYSKCLTLMGHILVARLVWLSRLEGKTQAPRELFPQDLSISDLKSRAEEVGAAWSSYLTTLTDAGLERVFTYRRQDGTSHRNTVADTLTHLYGHSLYHRGQIALLLRRMGAEPAATDFILFAREAVEEKAAG